MTEKTLFFIITAWAFLEAFQDTAPRARLISPAMLLSQIRDMAEIFLLVFLGAGIFFSANQHFPGAQDFLAALGMMVFYLYARLLKRRESGIWMAYACVFFLTRESTLTLIAVRSVEIAVGVTGLRMIFKGVQKRQLFSPIPSLFRGLPGFFMTAAIISLIFSSLLFVR